MSEENKTVELKDEDLEKVSGGFGIEQEVVVTEYKVFNAGDCFEYNNYRMKVINDYKIPVDKPQEIDVYLNGSTKTHFSSNYIMFNAEHFKGNNAW